MSLHIVSYQLRLATRLFMRLHIPNHVERVLDAVNRRLRMAQMVGRASVEFYVELPQKGREERERKVSAAAAAGQKVNRRKKLL